MSTTSSRPSTLYLYLHTHWDREWYWSFAGYRTQLVSVIKNILNLLEGGALDKFMLDGQTALIEDALEVSPGLGSRIKALVKAGKLSVGPWYVLADQMLVSGESLIRNLHYGLKLTAEYGGDSHAAVGYCPDTFGHSADLPRILRGFGIDTAVVWRGVPRLSDSPLFDWRSPDGSEVLTLDLTQGYYQSAFGEDFTDEQLAKYLLGFLELQIGDDGKLAEKINNKPTAPTLIKPLNAALFPVGADHVGPQADYKKQLEAALRLMNAAATKGGAGKITAETISLGQIFDFVRETQAAKDAAQAEPIALVETELRDNTAAFEFARAYMLDGVLSSRLYLKRDNRLVEHKLTRLVEPLRALLSLNGIRPYCTEEIDFNWKLLLKNQPHDSICGCSIDSVHREMVARTAALHDGLDLLVAQGKESILRSTGADSDVRFGARHLDVTDPALANERLLVFNPGAGPMPGPVRLRLALLDGAGTRVPGGFQQILAYKASETFLGLSRVPVFKDVTVVEGFLDIGRVPPGTLHSTDIDSAARAEKAAPAEALARIVEDEKAFGGFTLNNQFFSLSFDENGELIARVNNPGGDGFVTTRLGHKLVDVADAGDTYNFDPVADDEPLTARLVSVMPGKSGPLVSSLIAHYQIDLPEGLVERGSLGKEGEAEGAPQLTVFERARIRRPHKIETEITLKKDVPVVFFETTMRHRAADHRLEVVFSLPEAPQFTLSENHFSLIKRYHDKKVELNPLVESSYLVDLGHEAPLTRYPCQRFFVAGKYTFMNTGLPEYSVGLCDGTPSASITLLRAVSYLSRKRLRTRGGGAGPIMPTPEANCHGDVRATYGWAPTEVASFLAGDKVSPEAAPYVLTEIFESEAMAFLAPAGGAADKSLSLFALDHPDIRVTATFIDGTDHSQRLVIRLLNPTSAPKSLSLTLSPGVKSANLAGLDTTDKKTAQKLTLKNSTVKLEFKPCQLLTVYCDI